MRTDSDRRSFLKSAAIVTASSLLAANAHGEEKQPPTLNAGPNPDPGKPKLVVAPPKACDCHAHIIGPGAKYPFVAGRSFTPVEAHLDQYRRMLSALGLQRAVIIQPSFYGTDNSRTHDAIAESHGNWRGVAGLVASAPKAEIQRLHDAGFRGARVNLSFKGGPTLEDLAKVAQVVAPFGWHMQIQVEGRDLTELAPRFRGLATPLVIDHMGRVAPELGVQYPGFQALLALVREGNTWVKLSSAYAMSAKPYPYDDVAPFAKALIEAGPSRVVWGSNWPHPSYKGAPPVDATQLDLLAYWAPEEMRKRILVDNPAKLYGFPSA
jgi:predicted TIM-barrel fold metal-dependent hydrolase